LLLCFAVVVLRQMIMKCVTSHFAVSHFLGVGLQFKDRVRIRVRLGVTVGVR